MVVFTLLLILRCHRNVFCLSLLILRSAKQSEADYVNQAQGRNQHGDSHPDVVSNPTL